MIKYVNSIKNINEDNIKGFFVDWSNPPSPKRHLEILRGSTYFWLAIDEKTDKVVGFINAISDKVISAYIPLFEVLPDYKNEGIGTELFKRMKETLKDYYMVDLICDEKLVGFYRKFDMFKSQGMIIRNFKRQNRFDIIE
ncbi:GNAT family N-acetyltransferase [Clostridium sp. DMHC 10]|uniref:GNAT family N-acetyltransferase n=1 Tax=Clostridium sp. DMHC 10 TaxID=747377 RepID=UPI000AE7483D|nr:GNAT family N-acetyltransferase [Clostridium sp. DMHC 10]